MTPPPTTFTADTLAMSPRAAAAAPVAADRYNALLARLDAEVLARTQLEADLAAAREHAAYLQRRLATQPPLEQPPPPLEHGPPTAPAPAPRPDTKPQDKEILSHCSDISAVRAPPETPPLAKSASAHRKSSSNLAALAPIKKKGKKERAPKAKVPGQSRYWTGDEHKLFLEALNKFGHKDLRSISAFVGTRNMTQVRTHSQKYFMRLMREAKRQNPANKPEPAAAGPAAAKDTPTTSSSTVKPPSGPPADSNPSEVTDLKRDNGDKYSVPNTCGMTLLCLVGQDTLPV